MYNYSPILFLQNRLQQNKYIYIFFNVFLQNELMYNYVVVFVCLRVVVGFFNLVQLQPHFVMCVCVCGFLTYSYIIATTTFPVINNGPQTSSMSSNPLHNVF